MSHDVRKFELNFLPLCPQRDKMIESENAVVIDLFALQYISIIHVDVNIYLFALKRGEGISRLMSEDRWNYFVLFHFISHIGILGSIVIDHDDKEERFFHLLLLLLFKTIGFAIIIWNNWRQLLRNSDYFLYCRWSVSLFFCVWMFNDW